MTNPINPNPESPRSANPGNPQPAEDHTVARSQIPPSAQSSSAPHNALRSVQSRKDFFQSLDTWATDPNISDIEKQARQVAKQDIKTCYNNRETSLDLAGLALTTLPDLSPLSTLTELNLALNQLTQVNLRGLSQLEQLNLNNNKLTEINLQGLPALKRLFLDNNQLTSIDLQGLPALKSLFLENNQLIEVNLQGLTALEELNLADNEFTQINLQGLNALETLRLDHNQLAEASLQGLPALKSLFLNDNQLTEASLQGLNALETLCLNNNQFVSIDLQGLPALKNLFLNDNQLTEVNLRGLSQLEQLNLNNNQLTSIDLQHLSALRVFKIAYNQIASLANITLPLSSAIRDLYLARNPFNTLSAGSNSLERFSSPRVFRIVYNQIASLANIALFLFSVLRDLYLARNRLNTLPEGSNRLERFSSPRVFRIVYNQIASLANITLLLFSVLRSLRLAGNSLNTLPQGSNSVTMRISSGIIQDIPEDELSRYGVQIIPLLRDTITTSLPEILDKLYPGKPPETPQLLSDQNASNLARFLERMMLSWPRYDNILRFFVELAEKNLHFREELFDGIVSTETNCHDRPLYFFSRLSVTAAAYAAEENHNPEAIVQSLVALKYLDLIDAYAREACQNEALEVALYLQLQLKSTLHLPIAIESMGFNEYAQRAISGYLKQAKSVPEWIDLIKDACEKKSATDDQKCELLCSTPYFFKRCQNKPEIKRIEIMYAAAINLILGTTLDDEITDLKQLLDDKELAALGATSLKDLLSLVQKALPEKLKNTPLQNLTEGNKTALTKTLSKMREQAIQEATLQFMKLEAQKLINQAKP